MVTTRRYGMDMLFEFIDVVLKITPILSEAPHCIDRLYAELTASELAIWQQIFELARTHCTILLDVHLGLSPEQERQLFHDLNNLGKS